MSGLHARSGGAGDVRAAQVPAWARETQAQVWTAWVPLGRAKWPGKRIADADVRLLALPFLLALFCSALLNGLCSYIYMYLSFKNSGDVLAICTLSCVSQF